MPLGEGNNKLEHFTAFKRPHFALIVQPAAEQRPELSPTRGSASVGLRTKILSGAAEQRLIESGSKTQIIRNPVAAPRLRNYGDSLPKARRLALGLALATASQLDAQRTPRYRVGDFADSVTCVHPTIKGTNATWFRNQVTARAFVSLKSLSMDCSD